MAQLSSAKAKKILRDKSVRGHPLSAKQKRFFGLIAGGGSPSRVRGKGRKSRKNRLPSGKKKGY